jgi:hypothetical protein
MARVNSKRHAKPTASALSERTYRKVLKFHSTLLNQMAHIRLDITAARREDRSEVIDELVILKTRVAECGDALEHVRVLADHCARLLREKETLQKMLASKIPVLENKCNHCWDSPLSTIKWTFVGNRNTHHCIVCRKIFDRGGDPQGYYL